MKRFAATLAAVVLTSLAATPAAASDTTWERMPCESGAIDTIQTDAIGGVTDLTLAGHIDCAAPTATSASFGYAFYDGSQPSGRIRQWELRQYEPVPPTRFSERRSVAAGHPRFGVCVVTDEAVRVACVEVVWNPIQRVTTVRPLSTEAPLVDRKALVVHGQATTGPACGTCW